MKALISPMQDNLVVQVEENEFEIALPLYWVDCSDNISPYNFKYVNNEFVAYTPPPIIETQPTKEELLLQLQELTAKIEAL